jgi:CubicO group peptidase (beta-lactamase class C family)
MDSALLADGLEYLTEQNGFDIHSLTVIRNGHIVTAARFFPFQGGLHDLASVTKSFTATLVGMAIEQGLIEGVDQPVLELFPDRTVANLDADKQAMTVENLLTMSPGFECTHSPNDFTTMQMMETSDWVQFALDRPMTHTPGSHWVYCSPVSHLLSAIITESSDMTMQEFAQDVLFAPLGITESLWTSDPQGYNLGWGDLFLDPLDAAKLGYLYLHRGGWDGSQLVASDFVDVATSPAVSGAYGYQWWIDPTRSGFYADGAHGQRIFVFPDEELLVVTTGGGGSDYAVIGKLLGSYILPAVQAGEPMPANPDGLALLEARIEEATTPPLAEPLPPLPERALDVSGRTIVLDGNPMGLETMTLTFGEGEAEALLGVGFQGGMGLEWAIGLDGVPRISPGLHGLPLAATGAWKSDDVFVVDLDHLGNRHKERLMATFSEDQVDLSGFDVPLIGHLEGEWPAHISKGDPATKRVRQAVAQSAACY